MKQISNKILITSVLALVVFLGGCKSNMMVVDNSTVKDLDLDRYLGKWYEIARYSNSFEKGLVGVTADYSLKKNGMIKVVNSGYKNELGGKFKSAIGKAKIPDPNESAKLKVSFFWFFYSDYFVMELDEKDYKWAVVGSSTPKYLWILSREPKLSDSVQNNIIEKIRNRGYDTEKLEFIQQF